MSEISSQDCQIVGNFPNSPSNAWTEILTQEQRDAYVRINQTLRNICENVAQNFIDHLQPVVQPSFRPETGIRNNRPRDLWCSLVNSDSVDLVGMPQIFMIVSGRGVEIGLAPAIHRSDFSNQDVKNLLRKVTPLLFDLFPASNSQIIFDLSVRLNQEGGWKFKKKARMENQNSDFQSISELISYLHSEAGQKYGATSISRYYNLDEIDDIDLSFYTEFENAARLFAPLMSYIRARQAPVANVLHEWQARERILRQQEKLLERQNRDNNDQNAIEGRRKVFASITQRQGQAKFRSQLIAAYKNRCAFTGSNTLEILEAAHINPYNGPETNCTTNGILLRSDIHTLFDLGLLSIDDNFRILVSPEITENTYRDLHGQQISLPDDPALHPDMNALRSQRRLREL
ncbi:HNH endonuclease [Gluconobacter morbifer]|uniref:HNH nuclease domain-containing protein n=1 Tax=Gluconobacter morbifer G707 TaxID=1088869 RepID=G6XL35_9PROT|nr:HNH endonuclease signature motif containing protein [Gluconobacter morbifer]EHH67463.1 hypothetical protein GMO_24580 [Gluconobacter morbifer G707]